MYFYFIVIILSIIFGVENNSNMMPNGLPNLMGYNSLTSSISGTNTFNQNQNIQAYNQILSDFINPEEYTIGPGDVFLFNMVTSNRVVNLELITSPTGDILIPIIGTVNVKGKILNDVYNIIIDKCKDKYEDANVYINLIKLRNFKVLITGNFSNSGMYAVSSTNRVSDLMESISHSKKYLNSDSLLYKYEVIDYSRNIMFTKDISLIRGDSIINVDLFEYYVNSDLSTNPYLIEGDIINIKNSKKIAILGDIQNSIRTHRTNGIKYRELLQNANINTNNLKTIKVINYNMLKEYSSSEVDRISSINARYRSDIEDSYLASRTKTDKGLLYINDDKYLNLFLDFEVSDGDIIIIPNQMNYIELIGGVKKPGSYKYNSSFKVSDYLNNSGGFSEKAQKKNIYLIDNVSGERFEINTLYIPKPGDVIFIQETVGFKSWDRFTEYVRLAGTIATTSLVMFNIWDKLTEED